MTGQEQDEYLAFLRDGVRRGQASERIGLTRSQVAGYIAENPSFEARVVEAEGAALELVEEALFQAAISGNITAARHWMDLNKPRQARRGFVPSTAQSAPADDPDDSELRSFLDSL